MPVPLRCDCLSESCAHGAGARSAAGKVSAPGEQEVSLWKPGIRGSLPDPQLISSALAVAVCGSTIKCEVQPLVQHPQHVGSCSEQSVAQAGLKES